MQPTQNYFFRHPFFWTAFILCSLAGGIFSYAYFSESQPIVTIPITMSMQQALDKARDLATQYNLGPQVYKSVATFSSDTNLQNYIERERGGAAAWNTFIKDQQYHPYTWLVRHFNEGETRELYIRFTPTGEPYGFTEILSETEPRASLEKSSAQKIAQTTASSQWNLDLSPYTLVDSSQEVQPSGRVDHTFIYEKPLNNLGTAHYRVKIKVTGDTVSSLRHTIELPESFTRSFASIRAYNESVHSFTLVIVYLLYLLGGCLIGILILLKENWLLPKQALIAGIGLGLISLLSNVNQWPLFWFGYDTALSKEAFILKTALDLLMSFLIWSAVYTTTFLAAEGLTRRAFGSHIQLWNAWKLPSASSYTMLGIIGASYLIIGLDIAFAVLFYMTGINYWGWWQPSSSLFDPTILSMYVPAFNAIATSLMAGFWEECLFRAVPIASCALIGKKLGSRSWGLAIGFILQAIIFGAAHANYPAIPFYVRIVELIIPSFAFGAIYIVFGLIPGILSHTLYNATLHAIPLFISRAPGIWIQQALFLFFIGLPLLFILFARLRHQKWAELPHSLLNGAWEPVTHAIPFEDQTSLTLRGSRLSTTTFSFLAALGFLGLILWSMASSFQSAIPPLTITKHAAQEQARSYLQEQLVPEWYTVTNLEHPAESDEQTYIWQEGGPHLYATLAGNYLDVPHWRTRFATYTGNQIDRAHEYLINTNGKGSIIRSTEILPQSAVGKRLSEEAARNIAVAQLEKQYGLTVQQIQEVSAQSESLDNRTDWTFIFAEKNKIPLAGAQARIQIHIAGDKVVDASRSIHIPETWSRAYLSVRTVQESLETLFRIAEYILGVLIALAIGIAWHRKQLHLKYLLIASGFLTLLLSPLPLLTLPQNIATFVTTKSFGLQITTTLLFKYLRLILETLIIGFVLGFIYNTRIQSGLRSPQKVGAGIAAGCALAGTVALVSAWILPSAPWIPSLAGADSLAPWFVFMIRTLVTFITQMAIGQFLIMFAAQGTLSRKCIALLVSAVLLTPIQVSSFSTWVIACLIILSVLVALYNIILQHEPLLIPIMAATITTLDLIRQAYQVAFPGVSLGIAGALCSIGLFTYAWIRLIEKRGHAAHSL